MEVLNKIRQTAGPSQTKGLNQTDLEFFLEQDDQLKEVIDEAWCSFQKIQSEYPGLLEKDEATLIKEIQQNYVNFYAENAVNPYISLAAKGPWLVTTHGAILHDSGGYGMLGFGHSPSLILEAMNSTQVMANVMTANFSQLELTNRLNQEIGHTHQNSQPVFQSYLCLNSGSESVTMAARISDLNAKLQTDPGSRYQGHTIKLLAMKGGFHGRTDRPAQASDSSLPNYQKLASFRDRHNLITTPVNNVEKLRECFAQAEKDQVYIEMLCLEPVMGEGNPGVGITREFYDEARSLTKKYGAMLLIDSIQAGLRAHGCLSIVDYPGFQGCEAPDLETYSKAVNAGQYPLSILALGSRAHEVYKRGIYGNTMTTNPRALDVACAVLKSITPDLRKNIVSKGKEFLTKFEELKEELPDIITDVTGTGLLFAVHLVEKGYTVVGNDCIEAYLRREGIGVIHGGKNALRFTPHFNITSEEIDLIVKKVREALKRGPVYS